MFRRQRSSDGTDNDVIIIGVLLSAGIRIRTVDASVLGLPFARRERDGRGDGVCGLSSGEAGLARQALRAVHRTFVSAY